MSFIVPAASSCSVTLHCSATRLRLAAAMPLSVTRSCPAVSSVALCPSSSLPHTHPASPPVIHVSTWLLLQAGCIFSLVFFCLVVSFPWSPPPRLVGTPPRGKFPGATRLHGESRLTVLNSFVALAHSLKFISFVVLLLFTAPFGYKSDRHGCLFF